MSIHSLLIQRVLEPHAQETQLPLGVGLVKNRACPLQAESCFDFVIFLFLLVLKQYRTSIHYNTI